MRYKIKEHTNEGYKIEKKEGKHHILEIGTQQYIAEYASAGEARTEVRKYKLGKGFNGWTPPFMTGAPRELGYSAEFDDEYLDVD